MAKGYRYSLVFEKEDGNLIYLETQNESKRNEKNIARRKFPLTQIDAFTTRLNGEDELRNLFEYFIKEDIGPGNFYVEYVQNHKKKKLEIVYKDNLNLAYFSNKNIGKTYVNVDTKLETYVINLLNSLKENLELYRYLTENKYLNKYIYDKIKKYFDAEMSDNEEFISYAFKNLIDSITNYRIIRNIENGVNQFKIEEKQKGFYKKNTNYRLF